MTGGRIVSHNEILFEKADFHITVQFYLQVTFYSCTF